jgi:LacI family transcriptional regulator
MRSTIVTRPTINDLAAAAGVSVSTVNRVLAGADNVRAPTVQLVRDAAAKIGFYGLGSIQSKFVARRQKFRFGFLLLQPSRTFYKLLAAALKDCAQTFTDCDIEIAVSFAEDLSPQAFSAKLIELGESCHAAGVVAAVHPLVSQAVDTLQQRGVPVFALISQLSATGSVSYVGPDNWKAGRTAAWAIANMCKQHGKVGILVGNHRYRCQEMNESGFRSYFREFAPEFTLLEPLSTFETSAVAEEITEKLVATHPDLRGLFIAGGGISGSMNALRASGKANQIITVCHQLMDNTRIGLLDGTLSLLLHDPLDKLTSETLNGMVRACKNPGDSSPQTTIIPFDLYTRENI